MKKYSFYAIFLILAFIILLASSMYAKNEPEQAGSVKISPGMELKQVGTVNRLVPIGTKVVDKNGLVTTESMGEYVARRFIETGKRFDTIENTLARVKTTLEGLQQEIDRLQKLSELLLQRINSPQAEEGQ